MERNVVGRILPQMEQTRPHVPPATCLRVVHVVVQTEQAERDVLHVLVKCIGARACYGGCHEENQDVLVLFAGMLSFFPMDPCLMYPRICPL